MSKVFTFLFVVTVTGVLIVLSYTITQQQSAIGSLLDITEIDAEIYRTHNIKLWDLHERVKKLEAEDQRLMAHIRWFVMRRSGTNELRQMEAAVARLEKGNNGE